MRFLTVCRVSPANQWEEHSYSQQCICQLKLFRKPRLQLILINRVNRYNCYICAGKYLRVLHFLPSVGSRAAARNLLHYETVRGRRSVCQSGMRLWPKGGNQSHQVWFWINISVSKIHTWEFHFISLTLFLCRFSIMVAEDVMEELLRRVTRFQTQFMTDFSWWVDLFPSAFSIHRISTIKYHWSYVVEWKETTFHWHENMYCTKWWGYALHVVFQMTFGEWLLSC